ncbi:MAG: hypothetical protein H3Z51_13720 [archaeon]|nr:hypothetical protein [archaeon]
MKDEAIVIIFGLGCLTAIGIASITKGIDAGLITAISGAIGTVIGYVAKKLRK